MSPGSPVIEKLIENMWSIYGTHIVIRVRGHFDVTNEVVPRKYISFRLCVKIHRDLYMKTKAFFHAFIIVFTVELSGKDTDAGTASEQAEVVYENQLVYYGNCRHLFGADAAYHYVV